MRRAVRAGPGEMLPHSAFCAGPTTLRRFSYFVVPGALPGMLVPMKVPLT